MTYYSIYILCFVKQIFKCYDILDIRGLMNVHNKNP